MEMEILKQFCAKEKRLRYDITNPFVVDGWLYATDAHVMVRVPTDAPNTTGCCPPPVDRIVNANVGADGKKQFKFESPPIFKPEPPNCSKCDGKGYTSFKDCDSCYGARTFNHRGHDYDCKLCDGKGFLINECGCGQKIGVEREALVTVDIEGRMFNQNYIHLMYNNLRDLVMYFHKGGDMGKIVYFTFNGGDGFIIPCVFVDKSLSMK